MDIMKQIGLVSSEAGAKYKDAVDLYDAVAGKYVDHINAKSVDARLPTSQMPMAAEPKPFKLKGE